MIYEVKLQILCYAKYKTRETIESTKMHTARSTLILTHIALHLELLPKPVENEFTCCSEQASVYASFAKLTVTTSSDNGKLD